MEFQFGMNWSYYSHYVGDIFGAPLAIEGLMAFFLEATFVGLFFFGWDRLSKQKHLLVTFLMAFFALRYRRRNYGDASGCHFEGHIFRRSLLIYGGVQGYENRLRCVDGVLVNGNITVAGNFRNLDIDGIGRQVFGHNSALAII